MVPYEMVVSLFPTVSILEQKTIASITVTDAQALNDFSINKLKLMM